MRARQGNMKMCYIILIILVGTLILNDQFIVHWWIALLTLLTSFTSRAFSNWTFLVISNSFPKNWLSNLNFHIITCMGILVAMQCKKHLSTSPYIQSLLLSRLLTLHYTQIQNYIRYCTALECNYNGWKVIGTKTEVIASRRSRVQLLQSECQLLWIHCNCTRAPVQ